LTLGGTLGSIANSQLSNSSFSTTLNNGITGSSSVSLGGTLTLGLGAITPTSVAASGNVSAGSDERLKRDWKNVSPYLVCDVAAWVRSGTFERIDIGGRQAGSAAQDWEKILPEVVEKNQEGFLSLAYGNAALVLAIELAKRVVYLEERVRALEK
jgi:hypothetical protein